MTTASIYCRKSTQQEGRDKADTSVAQQEQEARAYAAIKGWTVDETLGQRGAFVDDAISGAEFRKRPGLAALLDACDGAARPDVVILRNVSRLGREQVETQWVLKQIIDSGARVACYQDDSEIDFSTATAKFMTSVGHFANEHQREAVSKDSRAKSKALAKAGRPVGRCYGYLTKGGQREIIPSEAAIVRRVFEERAAGKGYHRIARALTRDGVPSPSGKPIWRATQIGSMLHCETYRGKLVWGAERRAVIRGHKAIVPGTERVEVDKPAWQIIPPELWDKVAAVNATSAPASAKRWARSGALMAKSVLLPFVKCGQCGGNLHVRRDPRNTKRPEQLMCTARHLHGDAGCTNRMRVPAAWAEESILTTLEGALAPRLVADFVSEAASLAQAEAEDPAPIKREAAKVKAEIGRLVALAASGGAGTPEEILSAIQARKATLAALEARLTAPSLLGSINVEASVRAIASKAIDWRSELRKDPARATAVLRQILPERLALRERPEDGWTFDGLSSYESLIGKQWDAETVLTLLRTKATKSRARRAARRESRRG